MSSLNHLRGIDFSHESEFPVDTIDFGGLTNLRCLKLPVIDSLIFFSLHQFKGVDKLRKLKYLGISGISTKVIPIDFSRLNSLELLELSFYNNIAIDSIQLYVQQVKSLKVLYLTSDGYNRTALPEKIPDWLYRIKETNRHIKWVVFGGYFQEWPEEEIEKFRKATGLKTTVPKSWNSNTSRRSRPEILFN